MVLGLGSKKKGQSVKLEFQILIQEIKPWKPAQSTKTGLYLHWSRGDKRSGRTKSVVPDEDGKILFNESFKLPAKLVREPEGRGKNAGVVKFQKKTIIFSLLEGRTDRQLARCVVDLGEYGDADIAVQANSTLATGKKVVTGGSPTLYFKIGLSGKKEEPRTSFSARVSFGSKTAATAKVPAVSGKTAVEPDLDEETRKSLVAALMSDDDSIASFTDDEDEPTPESTPRTPSTGASSSKTAVSEYNAKGLPPPSPARLEVSKTSTPPSHPPPSPKREVSVVPVPPLSHPPPSSKLEASKVSAPPSHPPPPRPDASKVSAPPSHPPPPRPDVSKVSLPPSHPPPARPDQSKVSPPNSVSQTPKPDVSKVPPPRSIPSPARIDESKSSQSTSPKRDSGDATRSAASPVEKHAEASRSSGLFTSGSRSPTSSMDSTNNVPKVSKSSPSVPETRRHIGKVHTKHTPDELDEIEEKQRADLFSTDTSPRSSKASKSAANASEYTRGALELFSSGRTNTTRGASNSLPTPSEGSRSPLVSKDSSRGSSPSDTEAAGEAAGNDSAKARIEVLSAEKDRLQKSSIPLPPTSAKAAAAATAYASRRSYRTRGNSVDFTFDSGSEDSLSPVSNGGRSPAQSPLLHAQSGSLHGRSPSYSGPSRTQKSLFPQGPDVSMDVKQVVNRKEEKVEEVKNISKKEEGRRSYDRRDEKSEIRKMSDMHREENGPVKTLLQKREVADDDEGEAGSVLGTAKANFAKVEKKALEELRNKVANAEAKLLEANQKAQEQARQFSQQVERLEGELRETGAMEVALYCVVAEHANSSHKLHTPARRLARLYMHASKHWNPERKAGTAKNCVAGLVTVAKACGTDVSRLSFWWSNVVALRSVMVQACDTGSSIASDAGSTDSLSSSNSNGNGSTNWARRSSTTRKSFSRQDSKLLSLKPLSSDWQQPGTFITALEKIEGWIYTKIIESLWWQAMIPRMQKGVDPSAPTSPRGLSVLSPAALSEFTNKAKEDLNKIAGDVTGIFVKKPERSASVSLPELGDARQGNVSVEIWKRAMKDALCRLCPVRGAGHECGCLPMLIKTAIEGLCARLDVALFNAILRNEGDDVPTDPISDPVSDPSVLPISPGGLTFGGGSQLKNVVVTWSTFIHGLVSLKEPTFPPEPDGDGNSENVDDQEKLPKLFNLIKATGDLLMLPKDFLMDRAFRKEEAKKEAEKVASVFNVLKTTGDILQLPKDMLMDKALRREICPMLSLHLIRKILVNFVPDEFAPDPISPSLLAALNAEAAIEKQRHGEADDESSVAMAKAPALVYPVPSGFYVWSWIGEVSADSANWGRSSTSLLRRGYTSDEDLEVMEQLQENNASSKLDLILRSSRASSISVSDVEHSEEIPKGRQSFGEEVGASKRFQLLKPVWGTN